MIAGLPWTAWLLLVCAVVPGLSLALLFVAAHAGDEAGEPDGARVDESAAEAGS